MSRGSRPFNTLITGAIIVGAGFVAGVFFYALVGADQTRLSDPIQGLLVVSVGAIATGFVAAAGAYWAAMIAAKSAFDEGEATRRESRIRSRLDEKTDLVRRITVLASRHAQEVANQVARQQDLGGKAYEPLPVVNPTTPVEDAVNELYSIGFQSTADAAQQLFNSLVRLDQFCFVATPESTKRPIPMITPDQWLSFRSWRLTQVRMKTHMMDVGLRDEGSDHLVAGGTLPEDFLWNQYQIARAEIEGEDARSFALSIASSGSTSPPGQVHP